MKYSGKARKAAFRLIFIELVALLVILALGAVAIPKGAPGWTFVGAIVALWVLFTLFTLYFFRDPDARVPAGANLVLAPGHGKVDCVGTTTEPAFMGGECQRISIFLSVFDVHVQNAPVSGRIAFFKHSPGQYLNAMRADCAKFNE